MTTYLAWYRPLTMRRVLFALALGCAIPLIAKPDDAPNLDEPKLASRFEGRVMNSDGHPVPDARIYLSVTTQEPKSNQAIRARTDAEGRFAFEASDMTFLDTDGLPARKAGLLVAIAEGYGPDWEYVWNRQGSLAWRSDKRAHRTHFELELVHADVPIQGRFLDADGKPLAGAIVRLNQLHIPLDRNLNAHLESEQNRSILGCSPNYAKSLSHISHLPPDIVKQATTDADGRFVLSGLGRDRLAQLAVTSPAIKDTWVEIMTKNSPDVRVRMGDASVLRAGMAPQMIRGANFSVPLERGRSISGIVRDKDTQKPIAGMQVGIGREDYPRDGIWNHQTITDETGGFTITGLDPSIDKWSLTAVSAPGMAYQSASVTVKNNGPVVIECEKGIAYRLKLTDEAGQPVNDAEVTYFEVLPNRHAPRCYCFPSYEPISLTVRISGGIYQGFALPGPGAVLVKTPKRPNYQPAEVDLKAFFAPGRTEWTKDEAVYAYGTKGTLATTMGSTPQDLYAAIVLVNPSPGSQPLELSATIGTSQPVQVTLVDPDGKPVVGATTEGITGYPYDFESPLRMANLRLMNLHPNRARRITVMKNDRKLIGFLLAKGDGSIPATVRMQLWGEATGQILDPEGKPYQSALSFGDWPDETNADPSVGVHTSIATDKDGTFRIEKLIPGQRYTAQIHGRDGKVVGMAFQRIVLRPGETKHFGPIRIPSASVAQSRLWFPNPAEER